MSLRLGRVGRWLLGLWLCLLLLGLGWLVAVWTDWLPRPTEQEAAAVRALEIDDSLPARSGNALAWWMLAEYRLDAGAAQSLLNEAMAGLDTASAASRWQAIETAAKTRGHRRTRFDVDSPGCHWDAANCLANVRENLQRVRDALSAQQDWLEWASAIESHDHLRTPAVLLDDPSLWHTPNSIKTLSYEIYPRPVHVPLTAAAAEFAAGGQQTGMERLCQYVTAWRQVLNENDSLHVWVIGQQLLIDAASVWAQMRAQQPELDSPVCAQALAPLRAEELGLCAAIRAEHRIEAVGIGEANSSSIWEELESRITFNRRHTLARMAIPKAHYCQAAHLDDLQRRVPGTLPSGECESGQVMYNVHGCVLLVIAKPLHEDYARYERRRLDLDAGLRLLGASRWLRDHCGEDSRDACLQRIPLEWRSPAHAIELVDGGHSLRTTRLVEDWRGSHWSIPIDPPQQGSEQGALEPKD